MSLRELPADYSALFVPSGAATCEALIGCGPCGMHPPRAFWRPVAGRKLPCPRCAGELRYSPAPTEQSDARYVCDVCRASWLTDNPQIVPYAWDLSGRFPASSAGLTFPGAMPALVLVHASELLPEAWDRLRRAHHAAILASGGKPSPIELIDGADLQQVAERAEWAARLGLGRFTLIDAAGVEIPWSDVFTVRMGVCILCGSGVSRDGAHLREDLAPCYPEASHE